MTLKVAHNKCNTGNIEYTVIPLLKGQPDERKGCWTTVNLID